MAEEFLKSSGQASPFSVPNLFRELIQADAPVLPMQIHSNSSYEHAVWVIVPMDLRSFKVSTQT